MKRPTHSSLRLAALIFSPLFWSASPADAAKAGLNFQDDFGNGGGGAAVSDTSFDIPMSHWINLPRVPNSAGAPFSTGTMITLPGAGPLKVEWSAVNTYRMPGGIPASPGEAPGADQVVYGYLDDSGTGYRVTISGFRNSVSDYKLTLIAATDGGSGFTDANAVHSSGAEIMVYGVPNPGEVVTPATGGIYALTPESPVIATDLENNTLTITGIPRDGNLRSTLAGIILDYTPTTANVAVIDVQPVVPPGVLYTGLPLNLSVTATGSNLTYQWRKDGVGITGNASAATANLVLPAVTGADAGGYDVVVSGPGLPATSQAVAISVSPLEQPVFTSVPISRTVFAGYTATFTAAASGGEIEYVWTKEGVAAGTGPTLTLPSITPAAAGTYTITATNPVGTAVLSATLTVKTPVPGTYEAVLAAQQPLIWYRYDETDNAGLQDTTTNLGSLGAAGTGVGIYASYPTAGALVASADTAAVLDGSSARIAVAYQAALNTPQFTAEAWVKPALDGTAALNKCVLSCGDFGNPRAGWLIYQQPEGWNLRFYDLNGQATSLNITSGNAPVAGTWYHLAVTFDGTTATLYVNGTPTAGTPTGYLPGEAGPFCIGARADNGFFWPGSADEVAYYPAALSAASVQAHYANGINPAPAAAYDTLIAGDNASLYLRLNDAAFPPPSTANAGTLGPAADGVFRGAGNVAGEPLISLGESGPQPPDHPGFEPANTALTLADGAAVGNAVVPLGNTVTVTTWIKREAVSTTSDLSWPVWLGDGGMHLANGSAGTPEAELRYHWKGAKWDWSSGLMVPADVWTFAAMVVEPTQATFYMSEIVDGKPVLRTSVNTSAHLPLANSSLPSFGGNQPGNATRNFIGQLDESAVFNRALGKDEIASLFISGLGAPLEIELTSGGVADDSKPGGTPLSALNYGSAWLESSEDALATLRTGVQEFLADPGSQLALPVSTEFDSPTGTLSFWMRAPTPSGAGSEAAMIYDYRTGSGAVVTLSDEGYLFIQCRPGTPNSVTDGIFIADDLWHHVAITWNQAATSGGITIYVDGAFSSVSNNTAAWSWPAGETPLIGKSRDPYWKAFGGQLDDFRIYNQVLSAAEVSQIHASGALVAPAALKARYDFGTSGSGLTLTWPYGLLESSSTMQLDDPWTIVPGAASPFPVNPLEPRRFFRAKLP